MTQYKKFNALHYKTQSSSKKQKNTKNPIQAVKNFWASLKTKEGRKRALKIFFGLIVLGFFAIIALFAWYAKDLPTPGTLRERHQTESTKIYDRNDKLLFEVHGDQRRTVLKSEDIPELVKQATIAAEDRNFYEHHGFDIRGIARSIISNVTSGTRVGGSTLTQQFVKNSLLTNEKTYDRKIKELILSLEIEAMFNKDEILTLYLNEIPYGGVNYGIQSAAQSYFAKEVSDLELHEIAMLAAIPQRPTYFSPYGHNTDKLKERRDWILDSMVELGNIEQEQADKAKEEKMEVVPQSNSILAPHFVFYVKEQLANEYGEQIVEEGGLSVKTSLDLDLQILAQQAVKEGVERQTFRNVSNGALIAQDPKTGEILAMVGSKDYFDSEIDGNVNVTLSQQQPGSSFKPIVVAAAFKERFSPATTIWDVKTTFDSQGYSPNNYDLRQRGPVSIRQALGNSLNIPLVKLLDLIGLNKALSTARDLGITTLNDPSRYGLALVLGGGDVRPLDMATAFSTFASEGTYRPPISILEVKDFEGKILFEHQKGKGEKEVLPKEVAYQISHILSDNSARSAVFGSNSLLNFGARPVAVKTGTTQGFMDAWTVGYTPSLAVAVWVGNNDNAEMRNADGSVVAAPIFRQFLLGALQGSPIEQFNRPSTISTIQVDKLSAKLPTENSPETITEIFAPWQKPTEEDDVHVKVQINKQNDKLATEFTPQNLIEEKIFTLINSERPDRPNWQNPVLDWAKSAGYNMDAPPTEQDDMYDEDKVPKVDFKNLSNGSVLSSTTTIEAVASAHYGVTRVRLYIDDTAVSSQSSAPYNFTFNPSAYSTGDHNLALEVTDENGATSTNSIAITIASDNDAPGSVINVTTSSKSGGVELNWDNPSDADLAKIAIYVSTNPSELGEKHSTEIFVDPSSHSDYTVSLPAGIYYFTLRPVDSWGNERPDPPYHEQGIALP